MPKNLTFRSDDIDETVEFVEKIRTIAASGKNVYLSFDYTENASAPACIYLYSEIYLLQQQYGTKVARLDIHKAGAQAKFGILASGLLKLTTNEERTLDNVHEIVCGKRNEYPDSLIAFIVNNALISGDLEAHDRDAAENLAHKALGEAMLNVAYHAYPPGSKTDLWWVIAMIIDKHLYVVFADRGVGIPATLPNQPWFIKLKKILQLSLNTDAEMIRVAMEHTRTRDKGNIGRGWGTRDIQQFVTKQKRGSLTISSGKGYYKLNGFTGEECISDLRNPVQGTIIQWHIPIVKHTVPEHEYE